MKKIIFLLISLAFLAGQCRKEGEDCHFKIVIINNTSDSIICAKTNYKGDTGLCRLSGNTLKSYELYELRLNECWESSLADGHQEEIYIVDPSQYNAPAIFYSCDSIEIKNKVLKHYKLTLLDLKKLDFTITYP